MGLAQKILVIDDEKDFLEIISTRLEINHFDVLTAHNGKSGLQMLKKERPDLLLLDLMVPEIDGFELCRMIRFDESFDGMPIIILSAIEQSAEELKALGAQTQILKPFALSVLVSKVNEFLSLSPENKG